MFMDGRTDDTAISFVTTESDIFFCEPNVSLQCLGASSWISKAASEVDSQSTETSASFRRFIADAFVKCFSLHFLRMVNCLGGQSSLLAWSSVESFSFYEMFCLRLSSDAGPPGQFSSCRLHAFYSMMWIHEPGLHRQAGTEERQPAVWHC